MSDKTKTEHTKASKRFATAAIVVLLLSLLMGLAQTVPVVQWSLIGAGLVLAVLAVVFDRPKTPEAPSDVDH